MERSRFSVVVACLFAAGMVATSSTATAQWSTQKLSAARTSLSATSVGNKAFFAGGLPLSNVVDIFDNGTMSTATLSVARSAIGAGSLGTRAFFAGGVTSSGGYSSTIDVYDNATNQWTTASLAQPRANLVSTTTGTKVFFAGGRTGSTSFSDVIDIFDGTSWSSATLSAARQLIGATSVGTKAYFVGTTSMDIYDGATNTRTVVSLPVSMLSAGVTSLGTSVYVRSGSAVYVYDTNLGSWTTQALSPSNSGVTAGTVGSKVFLASGASPIVDVFDGSVSVNTWGITRLPASGSNLVATVSGSKILFAAESSDLYVYESSCATTFQVSKSWQTPSLCPGGVYLYTLTGAGSYEATGPGFSISNNRFLQVSGNTNGRFSVTGTTGGCFSIQPVDVSWSAGSCPTITAITPSGNVGDQVTIDGTNFDASFNFAQIVFFDGKTANPISATSTKWVVTVPQFAQSGPITYRFGNYQTTSPTNFTVPCAPFDVFTLDANPSICAGATVAIGVSPFFPYTYSWSPSTGLSSTTGKTVNASPLTTTTYTVTATNANGCKSSADIKVDVVNNCTVTLNGFAPTSGPAGAVVRVEGMQIGPTTKVYLNEIQCIVAYWTPTALGLVVPANATSGKIRITNGSNDAISSSDFIVCKGVQLVVTPDLTSCSGTQKTLTVSGGTTYVWKSVTGVVLGTDASLNVAPTTTTKYFVNNTGAGECPVGASTNVRVVQCLASRLGRFGVDVTSDCPPLTVTITDANAKTSGECSDAKPCIMSTEVAGSNANNRFSWTFSDPGSHLLQVKYSDGVVDDIAINVKPTPKITITGATTVCAGNLVTLTASGADTYVWTGLGKTGPTVTINPTATATYSVTGTSNGCSGTTTVTVPVLKCEKLTVTVTDEVPQPGKNISGIFMFATGGADNKTATLFHRPLRSNGNYVAEAPKTFTGPSVTLDVASDWLDELGMEYYVRVFDDKQNNGQSDIGTKLRTNLTNAVDLTVGGNRQQDYKIFSIPRRLSSSAIKTVFKDLFEKYGETIDETKWRLVRYQGGRNIDAGVGFNGIDIGRGYWFLSTEPFTLNLVADPIAVSQKIPASIRLEKGWNQIGNPFDFDISWASILQLNKNPSGVGKLFAYDATKGFYETDVLKAWSGGFVNSTSSVTIDVPVFVALASGRLISDATAARIDEPSWFLPLQIQHGGYESNTGGIGMDPSASLSRDAFDESTLPRWPKYVDISFPHPEYFQKTFTREFVPTADAYTWTFDVESTNPTGDATIRWESSALSLANAQLFLYDSEGGMLINMKRSSQYSFKLNGIKKFKILFARSGEKFVSDGFMVGAPFPNPSRDQISIPIIQQAAATSVSATVFDMLGRPVRQLQGEATERVYSELVWDGTDGTGNHVTQGTYIIRLTDGQTVYTHRVVIHKGQ